MARTACGSQADGDAAAVPEDVRRMVARRASFRGAGSSEVQDSVRVS